MLSNDSLKDSNRQSIAGRAEGNWRLVFGLYVVRGLADTNSRD